MIELILSVASYLTLGLLTARRIKFAMENSVARINAIAGPARAAYNAEKEACREAAHGYSYGCHYEYKGPVVTTVSKEYGGENWPIIWGGLLWPLTGVGTGFYLAYKAAAIATGPFFQWFFQNPKHRKLGNAPQVRQVKA